MDFYGLIYCIVIMVCVMENQVYVVMVNCVGYGDGGLVFVGGSVVVDFYGQLFCEVGCEECWQIVELDFGWLQDVCWDYCYFEECCLVLFGECCEYLDGLCELLIF